MGIVPARYLAFKHGGMSIRNEQGVPLAWISKRLGSRQLDFADESPLLWETFAVELEKRGLKPNMEAPIRRNLQICRRCRRLLGSAEIEVTTTAPPGSPIHISRR